MSSCGWNSGWRGPGLSQLEITRETPTGILGGADTDEPTAADPVPAGSPLADGSPIGVVTVPGWRPGLAQSVLPSSYRDLLKVLADAGWPLRAGGIAAAAALSTDRSKICMVALSRGTIAGAAGPPSSTGSTHREKGRISLEHLELRQVRGPILDQLYTRLKRCGDLAGTGRPLTEHRNIPALVINPGDLRSAWQKERTERSRSQCWLYYQLPGRTSAEAWATSHPAMPSPAARLNTRQAITSAWATSMATTVIATVTRT